MHWPGERPLPFLGSPAPTCAHSALTQSSFSLLSPNLKPTLLRANLEVTSPHGAEGCLPLGSLNNQDGGQWAAAVLHAAGSPGWTASCEDGTV